MGRWAGLIAATGEKGQIMHIVRTRAEPPPVQQANVKCDIIG